MGSRRRPLRDLPVRPRSLRRRRLRGGFGCLCPAVPPDRRVRRPAAGPRELPHHLRVRWHDGGNGRETLGHRPVAGPAHDRLGVRPTRAPDGDRRDVDPRRRRRRRWGHVDHHGGPNPPGHRRLLRDAGPLPRSVRGVGRFLDDDRLANRAAARGRPGPDLRLLSSGPTTRRRRARRLLPRSALSGLTPRSGYCAIPAVTEKMGGRKSLIIFHDSPSSRLAKSCPVFVPTYTPIGSAASTAIPSRRTPRYAPGPGKPFVERRHALPLFVVFQTAIWPFGNTRFPAPTNGATNAVCFSLGCAAIGNPKSDGRPFVTSVHSPPSGPR